jgi:hypothetical protein
MTEAVIIEILVFQCENGVICKCGVCHRPRQKSNGNIGRGWRIGVKTIIRLALKQKYMAEIRNNKWRYQPAMQLSWLLSALLWPSIGYHCPVMK